MKNLTLLLCFVASFVHAAERPNLLFITVDDMSADSLGCFGAKLDKTSPNIDAFAAQSRRFKHAHVVVGNCNPSRNVMFSGKYPHTNKVEGFYKVAKPGWPHFCDLVQKAGYYAAIRGKVSHSTPYQPYGWDQIDGKENGLDMKNAQSFYDSTAKAIAAAKNADKPFFINVNISDPHKPFYTGGEKNKPSHTFTRDEVPVPGFLPDHPSIRAELVEYYDSVRRADDCAGKILDALKDAGQVDNTIVFFLSDHGMPLPFAKTALWHHSTHTPLIIRWPGNVAANSWNESTMVSAVDLVPTWLDILGIDKPGDLQGVSFVQSLDDTATTKRAFVIKEYNENAGGNRHPMRGVQSKTGLYLFNPWSDGERAFATATKGTKSYKTMQLLAKTDEAVAARLHLFDHRVVEEFYDIRNDPDCQLNLIDHPDKASEIAEARSRLLAWMKDTDDHAQAAFEGRDDPKKLDAYVSATEAASKARRAKKRKGNAEKKAPPKQRDDLFTMTLPKSVKAGEKISLTIHHTIPEDLGAQTMTVTLKSDGERIDRLTPEVRGKGDTAVTFDAPETLGKKITFAAYVGKSYGQNLQFRTGGPVKVVE